MIESEKYTASGSLISGKIPGRLEPEFREHASKDDN
jgi:hypothetical protein